MTRLLIQVEGQTEETFVNEILGPHLYEQGYLSIGARLMGNARRRGRRGGVKAWQSVRKDVLGHLRGDSALIVGLMVDYYGMPPDWPGRLEATNQSPATRAALTIERALVQDVCEVLGSSFDPNRFVPHVMVHEFEAILFSDCTAFAAAIGQPDLTAALQEIRDQFDNPEEIDDSPDNAPSKRIRRLVPTYRKPLMGNLAVLEIGLDSIREDCPHFRDWLVGLEGLP